MSPTRPDFPFCAVSGQASLKTALILAAINPRLGGVLVSGPRGCAKSTLARGMADILPTRDDKRPPFVNLPLGATEDMLIGTLDLQRVIDDQSVAFRPGLLAKAHGGVLYVDEVNLLPDALVDHLLDVAASGVNSVERDGISHRHDAQFVLVGTMNPDEGELRPQLEDRFGLAVELGAPVSIEERMEIVRRRDAYDADPEGFNGRFETQQANLMLRIESARSALPNVVCPEPLHRRIAERCDAARVEGLRADIVWYRAATAHAAWCGRAAVTEADVDAVEDLVLVHRRKQPPQSPPPPGYKPESLPGGGGHNQNQEIDSDPGTQTGQTLGEWGSMPPQRQSIEPVTLPDLAQNSDTPPSRKASMVEGGRHSGSSDGMGRTRGCDSRAPDWFASLIASQGTWPPDALRFRPKRGGQSRLHLVLLDTSGSTLGNRLFGRAKGLVSRLAERVYWAREQLAIVGFGNDRVEEVLAPRRAPKHLAELMNGLGGGGGTPMREALRQAENHLQRWRRRQPGLRVHTYLLTDGRTTQPLDDLSLSGACTVIDMEPSTVKRGKAQAIARQLGAVYLTLPAAEAG